ncbi:MAG TPA: RIP metalloprotease RseP [Acidobacteriaceae bacterium]
MTVLQLLLVLGLMVLVHEFGHFAVAKWCGVRVETFAIGFGKRLVGFRRGDTDYQINALPLGGYVKMAGEIPGEETSEDPGDLNNHPRWQRMLIALAGPIANFILAFGLMTGAYMLHNEVNEYLSGPAITDYISPTTVVAKTGIRPGDTIVHFDNIENPVWDDILEHTALHLNQTVAFSFVHDGHRTDTSISLPFKGTSDKFSPEAAMAMGLVPKMQDTPIVVQTPTSGGPADRAGLKANDQIITVDGNTIRSIPALLSYLQDQQGKSAVLAVLRDDKPMSLSITPELTDMGDPSGKKEYHLEFTAFDPPSKIEQLPFTKAAKASLVINEKNSLMVVGVIKGMFQRHISVKNLSGPIGIGQVVHAAASQPGWTPLIGTMAMISINLGMFNLLPFPILDGGMIFLLMVESLFRRDLPMPIKERIYQVAFVCILLFAAMVIFNDITKLPFFDHVKT